jgi:hypothetical protein
MSQKSSVPQAVSFVSQALKRDTVLVSRILSNYYWPRESILVCSR